MVGDAGEARVHVRAAQLLGGHVLPGRRLHERWAADEDRAGPLHDHRLVAHRGHVRAARGAGAHHDRDLRDPGRRHARLVVEDAAEVLPVGEDLVLERQVRAARIDQVDARQTVLRRHLLGAQVLLDREREVRAALHRRVVGDDHALAALDDADPGHDPCARRLALVQVPRGERAQLEEGAVGVAEQVDPLPRRQLAAARGGAPSPPRRRRGRPAPSSRAALRRALPSAPVPSGRAYYLRRDARPMGHGAGRPRRPARPGRPHRLGDPRARAPDVRPRRVPPLGLPRRQLRLHDCAAHRARAHGAALRAPRRRRDRAAAPGPAPGRQARLRRARDPPHDRRPHLDRALLVVPARLARGDRDRRRPAAAPPANPASVPARACAGARC